MGVDRLAESSRDIADCKNEGVTHTLLSTRLSLLTVTVGVGIVLVAGGAVLVAGSTSALAQCGAIPVDGTQRGGEGVLELGQGGIDVAVAFGAQAVGVRMGGFNNAVGLGLSVADDLGFGNQACLLYTSPSPRDRG